MKLQFAQILCYIGKVKSSSAILFNCFFFCICVKAYSEHALSQR